MNDRAEVRVVTPEQLAQGYVVRADLRTIRGDYRVILRMADGNYLVEEPR